MYYVTHKKQRGQVPGRPAHTRLRVRQNTLGRRGGGGGACANIIVPLGVARVHPSLGSRTMFALSPFLSHLIADGHPPARPPSRRSRRFTYALLSAVRLLFIYFRRRGCTRALQPLVHRHRPDDGLFLYNNLERKNNNNNNNNMCSTCVERILMRNVNTRYAPTTDAECRPRTARARLRSWPCRVATVRNNYPFFADIWPVTHLARSRRREIIIIIIRRVELKKKKKI